MCTHVCMLVCGRAPLIATELSAHTLVIGGESLAYCGSDGSTAAKHNMGRRALSDGLCVHVRLRAFVHVRVCVCVLNVHLLF